MKALMMLTAVMMASGVGGQSLNDPMVLRHPKRVMEGNRVVMLTPLINWWKEPRPDPDKQGKKKTEELVRTNSPRPLTAWVRLKGDYEKTLPEGWIMTAEIQYSPDGKTHEEKIFLRHPPERERQRYEQLAARADQLRGNYSGSLNAAWGAKESAARSNSKLEFLYTVSDAAPSLRQDLQPSVNAQSRRSDEAIQRSQNLFAQAANASEELALVQKELNGFPPAGKEYRLDLFGMRTGLMSHGLPMYDLGMIY